MKTILKMPDGLFDDLTGHLLPRDSVREEAAFLFAEASRFGDHVSF